MDEDFDILDQQLSYLKDELDYKLGQSIITVDEYSRSIIKLSYEYSINGFPNDGLSMFLNVNDEYFAKTGLYDLQTDPELFNKCAFLFEIFEYLGIVPIELHCNQAPAKA